MSLRRIDIPPDFVDETQKVGTRGGGVRTRVGRQIQVPKKYAEDFEI